jgi:chromosome segregation ATPase
MYTVHLARRVDGELIDSGKSQRFEVVPLREGGTLPGMSPQELTAFRRECAEVQRSVGGARRVLQNTRQRLEAIRQTLDRSTIDESALGDAVRDLHRRVADMQERLSGNRQQERAAAQGPVSISNRLRVARFGAGASLYGPTAMHREVYSIAKREFAELKRELDQLVETELPVLERRLEEAGLPWTPGRGVPGDSDGALRGSGPDD